MSQHLQVTYIDLQVGQGAESGLKLTHTDVIDHQSRLNSVTDILCWSDFYSAFQDLCTATQTAVLCYHSCSTIRFTHPQFTLCANLTPTQAPKLCKLYVKYAATVVVQQCSLTVLRSRKALYSFTMSSTTQPHPQAKKWPGTHGLRMPHHPKNLRGLDTTVYYSPVFISFVSCVNFMLIMLQLWQCSLTVLRSRKALYSFTMSSTTQAHPQAKKGPGTHGLHMPHHPKNLRGLDTTSSIHSANAYLRFS